jgi:hypothetical protein
MPERRTHVGRNVVRSDVRQLNGETSTATVVTTYGTSTPLCGLRGRTELRIASDPRRATCGRCRRLMGRAYV